MEILLIGLGQIFASDYPLVCSVQCTHYFCSAKIVWIYFWITYKYILEVNATVLGVYKVDRYENHKQKKNRQAEVTKCIKV